MGEGIADQILANGGNDDNVINYPSGFGANMLAGGESGGDNRGMLSEADMLEAAIAASLADM